MKTWLFIVILALLLTTTVVRAETVQPTSMPSDDEVNAIARHLFCPVCENTPLDVCPTQACEQWRDLIRLKLAEGWSEEQIKDYFVVQYGYRVLAEPPRSGLNWLFYILVPVFFLIVIGIGVSALYGMRKSPAPAAASPPANDAGGNSAGGDTTAVPSADGNSADPYLAQLEAELRKRQKE